jgi:hypothetical protein
MGMMRRIVGTVWTGVVLALAAGCASGPLLDNPINVGAGPPAECEANPMYLPLGPTPESYRKVLDSAVAALQDFGFQVLPVNSFEGRVEALPRVAPGVFRFFRPGSSAFYDRLMETAQTYRHRATVLVQPADNGGYWVRVTVYKELEDLPRPVRATMGAANFRTNNDVERPYEVIDPTLLEASWLPRGEDVDIEQQLLARIRKCL